jgi:hypothetical protein
VQLATLQEGLKSMELVLRSSWLCYVRLSNHANKNRHHRYRPKHYVTDIAGINLMPVKVSSIRYFPCPVSGVVFQLSTLSSTTCCSFGLYCSRLEVQEIIYVYRVFHDFRA